MSWAWVGAVPSTAAAPCLGQQQEGKHKMHPKSSPKSHNQYHCSHPLRVDPGGCGGQSITLTQALIQSSPRTAQAPRRGAGKGLALAVTAWSRHAWISGGDAQRWCSSPCDGVPSAARAPRLCTRSSPGCPGPFSHPKALLRIFCCRLRQRCPALCCASSQGQRAHASGTRRSRSDLGQARGELLL